MNRQNWITVFTEDELRAALRLVATPHSATAVAAELYGLPADEQIHFNWIDTTLLVLSCVSEDVAQRVLEHFATSPEQRARMRAEQKRYFELVPTWGSHVRNDVLVLEDVVHDSRMDVAIVASTRGHASLGGNYIVLFSEGEVRQALTLLGPPDEAAAVAAELYSLPPERQAQLNWTDLALGLLSATSADVAEHVIATFGASPEREAEIREMQQFFRMMADSGELQDPRIHLELDTVVRGPFGEPPLDAIPGE